MRPTKLRLPVIAAALFALAGAVLVYAWLLDWPDANATHEPIPEVAIDVDVTGNEANSLGPTQACNETPLAVGDVVQIDIVVRGVPEADAEWAHGLGGVDFALVYDRAVLRIVGIELSDFMIFHDTPGYPFIIHNPLPDENGLFLVSAVDIAGGAESGDGVLARVSVEIVGAPLSRIAVSNIYHEAWVGPRIYTPLGNVYDVSHVADAFLHVGGTCDEPVPAQSPPPDSVSALYLDEFISRTLRSPEWTFSATGSPRNVLIRAQSGDERGEIHLGAAISLEPGVYPNVFRFPPENPEGVFLRLKQLPECVPNPNLESSMTVHEAEFGAVGEPLTLAADYYYHCAVGWAIHGSIRLNSTVPFVAAETDPSFNLDFGRTAVGTSVGRTVTIKNTGTASYQLHSARVGPRDPIFRVNRPMCPDPIEPGETCQLTVTFSPSDTYLYGSGTLVMEDNTNKGIRTMNLFGTAAYPILSHGGAHFNPTQVGKSADPSEVTIHSLGLIPARITGITVDGPAQDDFFVHSEDCLGRTLVFTATCRLVVDFAPLAPGERHADIHLDTDPPEEVDTVVHLYGLAYYAPEPTHTPRGSSPRVTPRETPHATPWNPTSTTPAPTITPTPDPQASLTPTPTPRPSRTPR